MDRITGLTTCIAELLSTANSKQNKKDYKKIELWSDGFKNASRTNIQLVYVYIYKMYVTPEDW